MPCILPHKSAIDRSICFQTGCQIAVSSAICEGDDFMPKYCYRISEDGTITIHNYLAAELPVVINTVKSGRTTYRYIGSYDGTRSLPAKLLTHMVKDSEESQNGGELFTNE